VFLAAGVLEVVVNPLLGRFSDRRGRLLPIRAALAASVGVAVAFAVARDPYAVSVLAVLAAIAFGAFYTPGMALVSDRSETAGLSQALGFGVMNTAWALGNMSGPALAGTIADATGDAVPYLLAAVLCALTLIATARVSPRPGTARAPT
jgi:MFS family permease